MPRFAQDTYAANLPLRKAYQDNAAKVGCTPAQLALAWLLQKDSSQIPIPGTQNIAHLEENMQSLDVHLSAQQMLELDTLVNQHTVKGARYNAQSAIEVDTEEFA
jgi:aryl-alcohol dehydrogenase-like predicted oxidoreductase